MQRILTISLLVIVVLAAGLAALFYSGVGLYVLVQLAQPRHGWDLAYKAPAPDYARASSWAALPGMKSLANLVPPGAARANDPGVDVFFVHPTGAMNDADWNSPLDANSRTEENTKWMMTNQASAFNGCCAVYAPRYREASIFVYFAGKPDIEKKALDFAYGDVDRAFTYFLEHYSRGRPFILASHSQGTAHAFRLIRERIDGTPLAGRLVAAYLLGGGITNKDVAALKTVHACNTPTDLHCVIHWATWGNGGTPRTDRGDRLLCVNPLTWKRDGGVASARLHKGAVPVSGAFSLKLWGSDAPAGTAFPPLKAPVKAWATAECRGGLLFVPDQTGGPFDHLDMGGKNYHGLDYPLFAMDIRENAIARVGAFMQQAAGK